MTRLDPHESSAVKPSERGWPRPTALWHGGDGTGFRAHLKLPKRLPMPWINGTIDEKGYGDFHSFRDDSRELFEKRTCLVCGLEVPKDEPMYIPSQGADPEAPSTSGGGGHARCTLTAVRMCPHLVEHGEDAIVFRWDGPGSPLTGRPPEGFEGIPHGDHDPLKPGVVPLTRDEFIAEVRAMKRRTAVANAPR